MTTTSTPATPPAATTAATPVREFAQTLAQAELADAARELTAFADALDTATAVPERPAPVPGWVEVTGEGEDAAVSLVPAGVSRLYEELCRIADPVRLRAAVVLLLNLSVRLQQVPGGAQAAAAVMQCGAELAPVLEAVNGGAPPLVGRAALQLTVEGEQVLLADEQARWITAELDRLPAGPRRRSVLGLAALAEQLETDPDAVRAAQALRTVAADAARALEGEIR
ncbi:hypothetical protein [Streptomyces sp. NBC_00162]|uniref:hypothetical protein n=1 Tax=Streptomyces sp. NBC_00162 TaxID=2903629 RepID=UPI00214C36F4|nr:hypothetical protein [Streptomyces sp. NBC_00162]UUU45029.1 hypothetical protein JIW86_40485 [Streptomyces sp. NBC_00162]